MQMWLIDGLHILKFKRSLTEYMSKKYIHHFQSALVLFAEHPNWHEVCQTRLFINDEWWCLNKYSDFVMWTECERGSEVVKRCLYLAKVDCSCELSGSNCSLCPLISFLVSLHPEFYLEKNLLVKVNMTYIWRNYSVLALFTSRWD